VTQTVGIILTAIVSVAVALGIAYSVFRSTARTNTTLLYERENDALTKALLRQEAESVRLQTKVETLVNTNAVLQETVSGAAAVRTLAVEIQREETARRDEHQIMMALLKDVIATIRQARGTLQ
jgi:hypothetical protein